MTQKNKHDTKEQTNAFRGFHDNVFRASLSGLALSGNENGRRCEVVSAK